MMSIIDLQHLFTAYLNKNKLPASPENLYDPIRYFMEIGGKRIRPILCLLGCQMFSDDISPALAPALAVEYFHNFSLLHDDIMDKAPLRRGFDTIHIKYGINNAILSGDAMLVKSYEFLSDAAQALPQLIKVFTRTALQVCEGQQYDMDFENRQEVSIPEYLLMIELKTAVLLAASLSMGAICAGAKSQDVDNLYQFGKNIGIAFQLQDDLLDTFGNPDVFGKKIGGDIAQNKKTYLMLKTIEIADQHSREKLNHWLNVKENDTELKIANIKSIMEQLRIPEVTKAIIQVYYQKAFSHLNQIDIEDSRKNILIELTEQLMFRQQ